jgi:hypothetical protein
LTPFSIFDAEEVRPFREDADFQALAAEWKNSAD